jgi:hypothetical protein
VASNDCFHVLSFVSNGLDYRESVLLPMLLLAVWAAAFPIDFEATTNRSTDVRDLK